MVITGGTQGGVGGRSPIDDLGGRGRLGAPDGLGPKGLAHQDMSDFFTRLFPYKSMT
jgi:hypothetical protein